MHENFNPENTKKRVKSRALEISDKQNTLSEILNRKYNRLKIKYQLRDIENQKLQTVLENSSVMSLYLLETDISEYKCYLIINKSERLESELNCIEIGSYVGIYGNFIELIDGNDQMIYIQINDPQTVSFLAIYANFAVSVTTITETFNSCSRKHALSQRFHENKRVKDREALLGTSSHATFSEILISGNYNFVNNFQTSFKNLLQCNNFFFTLKNEICNSLVRSNDTIFDQAMFFIRKYLDRQTPIFGPDNDKLVLLSALAAEENVKSYRFSIRGKIDLRFLAEYYPNKQLNNKVQREVIFELKTGKRRGEHEDQTMLYTICWSDEFDPNGFALLYYTLNDEMVWVKNDIKLFLFTLRRRNKIAQSYHKSKLPPVTHDLRNCNDFCNQVRACSVFSLIDSCKGRTEIGIEDFGRMKIPVLNEMNYQFDYGIATIENYKYMQLMFENIEAEFHSSKKSLTLHSNFQVNFELDNLFILHQYRKLKINGPQLINFSVILESAKTGTMLESFQTMKEGTEIKFQHRSNSLIFFKGIIQNKRLAISQNISQFEVTLKTANMRDLDKFFALVEKKDNFLVCFASNWQLTSVEKNDFQLMNFKVLNFITNPNLNSRVKLIVTATQKFGKIQPIERINLELEFADEQIDFFEMSTLNFEQKQAIYRILKTKELITVQGFPGCGKTHMVVYFLAHMIFKKRRVLITSYTHKSLNVILARLFEMLNPDDRKKVMRLVRNREPDQSDSFDVYDIGSINDQTEYHNYVSRYVFCSTILSLDKFNFESFDFDFVLVDEASQVVEPLLLHAIGLGKKFVLIGDYLQLRPLLRNKSHKINGITFEISLFEKLCKVYPEHSVNLRSQYRMNKDIMYLVNLLVYQNQLKAATNEVLNQRLNLVKTKEYFDIPVWLQKTLFPENHDGICFINTFCEELKDPFFTITEEYVKTKEKWGRNQKESQNKQFEELLNEAPMVDTAVKVCEYLINFGAKKEDILIVTTLNKQREMIDESVRDVNVVTIDKSQGSDSLIIILVLSNNGKPDCPLLENFQRINVAISRAKAKLIIIADSEELSAYEKIKPMVDVLIERQWMVHLPSVFQKLKENLEEFVKRNGDKKMENEFEKMY